MALGAGAVVWQVNPTWVLDVPFPTQHFTNTPVTTPKMAHVSPLPNSVFQKSNL